MTLIVGIIILIICKQNPIKGLTKPDFTNIYIRSFFGLISITLVILTSDYIPLAVLTIIQKSSAFWASILGFFIIGDKLHRVEIIGVFLGFFGIYLIMYSEFAD